MGPRVLLCMWDAALGNWQGCTSKTAGKEEDVPSSLTQPTSQPTALRFLSISLFYVSRGNQRPLLL